MRAGDTFIRAGKHIDSDSHLWVVLSDPAKDKSHLVIVNVTSQQIGKDQSCVIHRGENPFIENDSVILYAGARVVPESAILGLIANKTLVFKSSFSKPLLARVRAGAALTKMLPLAAKRILQEQGFIPDDQKPPEK